MKKPLFFFLIFIFSCTLSAFQENTSPEADTTEFANTHFISDELFIYMHSGPGTNYRIIGSINAGSPIIPLEEKDDFTQIRDAANRTGWVKSEFVSASTSLKRQLQQLQLQVTEQQSLGQQYSSELSQTQLRLEQSEAQRKHLETDNTSLQAELSRVSQELEQINKENANELFYMGAVVAGTGLIFGILLTLVLKRRKRSDVLYDRF